MVGDKLRNLKGAIAAALGTITPCFCIILLIAMFLTPEMITTNPAITAVFKGIRPVVVALILAPVFTTARASHIGWKMAWIPALVALLIWSKWPVVSNPILYIVAGGLTGYWQAVRTHKAVAGRTDTERRKDD